jgi:hypothetical protein
MSYMCYSCEDCGIKDEVVFAVLNMFKDGSTNWTVCYKCKKFVKWYYKKLIVM